MPVPFHPAPAAAPCFDPATRTWTLSQYEDVSAALADSALLQGADEKAIENELHSPALRNSVQADLARITEKEWVAQAASSFADVLNQCDDLADLVRDVIHPWTLRLIVDLNQGREAPELGRIAAQLLFGAKGERRTAAERELERMIEDKSLITSKSMFFGLTQTLPSFLSKAWLALLEHPAQAELLLQNPALIGSATEELLRFAGPVHTLYRWASEDVQVGEAAIQRGQSVVLAMDSANYDAERFPEPERLDLTRATAGHLGLGRGAHACVGSVLVRMASRGATPLLLAARPAICGDVMWTADRTSQWPSRVPVRLS